MYTGKKRHLNFCIRTRNGGEEDATGGPYERIDRAAAAAAARLLSAMFNYRGNELLKLAGDGGDLLDSLTPKFFTPFFSRGGAAAVGTVTDGLLAIPRDIDDAKHFFKLITSACSARSLGRMCSS